MPMSYEPIITELDQLSNSVLDAIEEGDYEEAERRCQQLLRDYPEVIDGHDRLGRLREAQGRFEEAARHYTRVLEIICENPEGFDQESIDYRTQRRDDALAKAKK